MCCAKSFAGDKTTNVDMWPSNLHHRAYAVGTTADNRGVQLSDGTMLDTMDAFIFCTGYLYDLPFDAAADDDDQKSAEIFDVKAGGRYVSTAYEHCVSTRHPRSLFFIGLRW